VELFTCWKATLPTYLVVTPIVGCCLTLVLVQLKLGGYNRISWTTTSVPLWLITIFGSCRQVFHIQYFVGNKTFRKSIALSAAISFIAIPTVLPLTLMSYAYDHFTDPCSNIESTVRSSFYYPHLAALTLWTSHLLFDHIRLWVKYLGCGFNTDFKYLSMDREVFKSKVIIGFVALFHCVVACVVLYTLFLSVWGFMLFPLQPVAACLLLLYLSHVYIFSMAKYAYYKSLKTFRGGTAVTINLES
jgi:hypothetical protein